MGDYKAMRLFTEHPATVGETYVEHMGSAFSFGTEMVTAGFACLLHGLFPFLFEKTGSNAIQRLHHRMVTHRDKRSYGAAGSAPAGPAE